MKTIFLFVLAFFTSLHAFTIVGELPPPHQLLKKIQSLSEEERRVAAPEFQRIIQALKGRFHGDFHTLEFLHEELTPAEAFEIFGPCLEPSFPFSIFQSSFLPQFYFIRFTEKTDIDPSNYFTSEELDEIVQVAHKIKEKTTKDDILLCLGQSPAYLIEALEELNPDASIFKVPFSGAPDFCLNNFHYKKVHLSNLTTPASVAFYKSVLQTLGVSPASLGSEKTLVIVDLVGTGGSIASFIKILVDWYKSESVALPEIKLLDISVENRNFKSQTKIRLPFSDNCAFELERLFIHTSAELSDKLDYTEGQDRILPPFSALQWKPEYMRVFDQYPNDYARKIMERVKAAAH